MAELVETNQIQDFDEEEAAEKLEKIIYQS
jgi:hypothetical protein